MTASSSGKPRNSHWCLQGARFLSFHANHRLSLIQSLLRIGTVGTTGRVHSPLRSCRSPAHSMLESHRVRRHKVPCIPQAHQTQQYVGIWTALRRTTVAKFVSTASQLVDLVSSRTRPSILRQQNPTGTSRRLRPILANFNKDLARCPAFLQNRLSHLQVIRSHGIRTSSG